MDKGFKEVNDKIKETNDKMNKGFKEVNDKIKETNDKMDKGFEQVNNKLDIVVNSNIAQILIAQTKNTKELNEKIDKYIEKNETEHKKFDYEIADTRMKIKFAR